MCLDMRSVALLASVCCAAVTFASNAAASSGWMSAGDVQPVEQRVAIAAGPTRTVVWSSLRFQGSAAVALVVPAADGAVVDLASDAWFEALEANTAPRVVPPTGGDACPGTQGFTTFELIGDTEHRATTAPDEVTVLADATSVDAWAAQRGIPVDPGLDATMRSLAPAHFVVLTFPPRANGGTTATVRVTTPGPDLRVPLSLTHATGQDLMVTTFVLAQGRTSLVPETPVSIPSDALAWFAATGHSSYASAREQALVLSNEATLTESAGHEGLGNDRPFSSGLEQIDSLVRTYMDRGAAYDPGAFDLSACELTAAETFNTFEPVAESCPAGEVATIGTPPACAEGAGPGKTPPADLRCGTFLDDLALGLEGMRPAKVWLTRETLLVESGHAGLDLTLDVSGGVAVSNVLSAGFVDKGGCATSSGNGNGNGNGSNGSGSINLGGGSDSSSSDSCDSSNDGSDSCDSSGDGGDSCDSGGGDSCDGGGGEDCSGGGAGSCDCTFGRTPKPRGSVILMVMVGIAALLRRRGSKRRRAAASS